MTDDMMNPRSLVEKAPIRIASRDVGGAARRGAIFERRDLFERRSSCGEGQPNPLLEIEYDPLRQASRGRGWLAIKSLTNS